MSTHQFDGLRTEYADSPLRRCDLLDDPMVLLQRWLEAAANAGWCEPNAMALATCDAKVNRIAAWCCANKSTRLASCSSPMRAAIKAKNSKARHMLQQPFGGPPHASDKYASRGGLPDQ